MHSQNHTHGKSRSCHWRVGTCLSLMLISALVLGSPSRSQAQETNDSLDQASPMTVGFESDLSNGYFWHGLECSYGKVFQNSAWIGTGPITFSLWSNYEPSAAATTPDLNELDAALSLATALGNMSLEPAVNFCLFPDQPDVPTTVELSLRMAVSLGALQPFMVHTVDVKAYPGAYFGEIGLSGSWSLSDQLTFETAAEIGWGSHRFNEAYLEIAQPSVQLVQWDVALCWAPAGALYVRPHVGVSAVTDKVIRESLDRPSLVQGGIAVGVEF